VGVKALRLLGAQRGYTFKNEIYTVVAGQLLMQVLSSHR